MTAAADVELHRPVRLHRLTWAGEDVGVFELRSLDGEKLPPWDGGAHVDLVLGNGLVRPYSLLPCERADTYRLAIKRRADSAGATRWLFSRGHLGATFKVSNPRNSFALRDGSAVLIGGGIGITPLVSMAAALDARGERDWQMHAFLAGQQDGTLAEELAPYGDRVRHHVEAGSVSPDDVRPIVAQAPADAQLYCCGPTALLDAFRDAVVGEGATNRAHLEYFDPVGPAAPKGGYTVVLARSGIRLPIAPGTTILGAMRKVGLSVPVICERGFCGVCETAVLGGTPHHRDAVLSTQEQQAGKAIIICRSGSLTPELVLDL